MKHNFWAVINDPEHKEREKEKKKKLEYSIILKKQIEDNKKAKELERQKLMEKEMKYQSKIRNNTIDNNHLNIPINKFKRLSTDTNEILSNKTMEIQGNLNSIMVSSNDEPRTRTNDNRPVPTKQTLSYVEDLFALFIEEQIKVIDNYEKDVDIIIRQDNYYDIAQHNKKRAIDHIEFEKEKLKNKIGFFPLENDYKKKIDELFDKILNKKIKTLNEVKESTIRRNNQAPLIEKVVLIPNNDERIKAIEYHSKYDVKSVKSLKKIDNDSISENIHESMVGFSKFVEIDTSKDNIDNNDDENFLVTWRNNIIKQQTIKSNQQTIHEVIPVSITSNIKQSIPVLNNQECFSEKSIIKKKEFIQITTNPRPKIYFETECNTKSPIRQKVNVNYTNLHPKSPNIPIKEIMFFHSPIKEKTELPILPLVEQTPKMRYDSIFPSLQINYEIPPTKKGVHQTDMEKEEFGNTIQHPIDPGIIYNADKIQKEIQVKLQRASTKDLPHELAELSIKTDIIHNYNSKKSYKSKKTHKNKLNNSNISNQIIKPFPSPSEEEQPSISNNVSVIKSEFSNCDNGRPNNNNNILLPQISKYNRPSSSQQRPPKYLATESDKEQIDKDEIPNGHNRMNYHIPKSAIRKIYNGKKKTQGSDNDQILKDLDKFREIALNNIGTPDLGYNFVTPTNNKQRTVDLIPKNVIRNYDQVISRGHN